MATRGQIFLLLLVTACAVESYSHGSRHSYVHGRHHKDPYDYRYSRHRTHHHRPDQSDEDRHNGTTGTIQPVAHKQETPNFQDSTELPKMETYRQESTPGTNSINGVLPNGDNNTSKTITVNGLTPGNADGSDSTITVNGKVPDDNGHVNINGNGTPDENNAKTIHVDGKLPNVTPHVGSNINGKVTPPYVNGNVNKNVPSTNIKPIVGGHVNSGEFPNGKDKPHQGAFDKNGPNPSGIDKINKVDVLTPGANHNKLNNDLNKPDDISGKDEHKYNPDHGIHNSKHPGNVDIDNNSLPNNDNIDKRPDNSDNNNRRPDNGDHDNSDNNRRPINGDYVNNRRPGYGDHDNQKRPGYGDHDNNRGTGNEENSNDITKPHHYVDKNVLLPNHDKFDGNKGDFNVNGLLPGGDSGNPVHNYNDVDQNGFTHVGKPDRPNTDIHGLKPNIHIPHTNNELPAGGLNTNQPTYPGANIVSRPDHHDNDRKPSGEIPVHGGFEQPALPINTGSFAYPGGKFNNTIMPVYLPVNNGQVYPGGSVSSVRVPAFYVVMINGHATLVRNPGFVGGKGGNIDYNTLLASNGGGISISDLISSGLLSLPSLGGISGIGVLPAQQPIWTGSQYPQPIAQPVVQPIEEPVAEPIAEPVAQPIAQPIYPQPIPYPVPEPSISYPNMPYPYPWPMWDNNMYHLPSVNANLSQPWPYFPKYLNTNMNWPGIIDFLIKLGSHLSKPALPVPHPEPNPSGKTEIPIHNHVTKPNYPPLADEKDISTNEPHTVRPTEQPAPTVWSEPTPEPEPVPVSPSPKPPVIVIPTPYPDLNNKKEPVNPFPERPTERPIYPVTYPYPVITNSPIHPVEPYPNKPDRPEEPIVIYVTEKPDERPKPSPGGEGHIHSNVPRPNHNERPNSKPSSLDIALINLLNHALKLPNRIPNTKPRSDKDDKDLIKLLIKVLRPNAEEKDIRELLDNQQGFTNISQLLLALLAGNSQPNMNLLVEPGMDEATRSNLILILNLLAGDLASDHSTAYYEQLRAPNPLLYFLGHFPCDQSNFLSNSGISEGLLPTAGISEGILPSAAISEGQGFGEVGGGIRGGIGGGVGGGLRQALLQLLSNMYNNERANNMFKLQRFIRRDEDKTKPKSAAVREERKKH